MYEQLTKVASLMPDEMFPGYIIPRAIIMLENGQPPERAAEKLITAQRCWRQPAKVDRQCFCGDVLHQRHVDLCRQLATDATPKVMAEALATLQSPVYRHFEQVELYLELGTLMVLFGGLGPPQQAMEVLVQLACQTLPVGHILGRRMARTLQAIYDDMRIPHFSNN